MDYYRPEPEHRHDAQPRVGILLANLGTPDAATSGALRPYLRQFLSDRRVIEIPRAIWWWILNGLVLPLRPRRSAHKYAQIWSDEGSPLLAHTQKQARLLQDRLAAHIVSPYAVEFGMRYGNPSIREAVEKLKAQHCDRILLFPLYPQYAASSVASSMDELWRTLLRVRNVPAVRTIRQYHDHPAYIAALAQSVREHWAAHGKPDKLLMSFHGVPRFTLLRGDPYFCQCQKTGRLLAEALGLTQDQYLVCFQSRFGRAEWLQPYLAETLVELGRQQLRRVDVICPGFAADCLETLEEIAMEGRTSFLEAGGSEYHYIPALNERDDWIQAMCDIALENLQGWISSDWNAAAAQIAGAQTVRRAQAFGAKS